MLLLFLFPYRLPLPHGNQHLLASMISAIAEGQDEDMSKKNYCPNARMVLSPYEDQMIEVKARLKEFRDHPTREDLRSAVFVPAILKPFDASCEIHLHHLWILHRHLQAANCRLYKGRWTSFIGSVYSYKRLGGKSNERGLKGTWDFGVLPVETLNN